MTKNTIQILERIKALKIEEAELLALRKNEVFQVLQNSGGIVLDNCLIAGLAIYANNPDNAQSNFLRELEELGKTVIPSKGNRKTAKKANTTEIR